MIIKSFFFVFLPVRGFPFINKSVQKNKLIIKIHTRKKKNHFIAVCVLLHSMKGGGQIALNGM